MFCDLRSILLKKSRGKARKLIEFFPRIGAPPQKTRTSGQFFFWPKAALVHLWCLLCSGSLFFVKEFLIIHQ